MEKRALHILGATWSGIQTLPTLLLLLFSVARYPHHDIYLAAYQLHYVLASSLSTPIIDSLFLVWLSFNSSKQQHTFYKEIDHNVSGHRSANSEVILNILERTFQE